MLILNRQGEEPAVWWNYCCFLEKEHVAESSLQAILTYQAEYLVGLPEYVLLFTFLNKPREDTTCKGQQGCFALLFTVAGHQRSMVPPGRGSSLFHVVQGSSPKDFHLRVFFPRKGGLCKIPVVNTNSCNEETQGSVQFCTYSTPLSSRAKVLGDQRS